MRKQSSVLAFETRLKQETRLRLAMDTSLASLNTRFSEAFFSRVDNGVFACFTALFLCVVLRFLPVDLWPRPWPLGGGVVNPDAIPDDRLRSIALPLSSLSLSPVLSQVPAFLCFLEGNFKLGGKFPGYFASCNSCNSIQIKLSCSSIRHAITRLSRFLSRSKKIQRSRLCFRLATWNNKRVHFHSHLSTSSM